MTRTAAVILGLLLGGILIVVAFQCQPTPAELPSERVSGKDGPPPPPADARPAAIGLAMPARLLTGLRLVSLSPAVSRTLVDLGLEPAIVGRSRFCTMLDPELPVCGDLLSIDVERLIALEPTHVLRQPPSGESEVRLATLAREQGWAAPITMRLDDIEDVRRLVDLLPRRIGERDDRLYGALAARARVIDGRLAALVTPSEGGGAGDDSPGNGSQGGGGPGNGRTEDASGGPTTSDPPRDRRTHGVLLVHAVRPPGVFGRETYLDAMLATRGWPNAFTGRGWRTLSMEDLVRLDPASILLVAETEDDGAALETLARRVWEPLELRAMTSGRMAVLVHSEVMRPSTGLIEVAAALDAALLDLDAVDGSVDADAPAPAGTTP